MKEIKPTSIDILFQVTLNQSPSSKHSLKVLLKLFVLYHLQKWKIFEQHIGLNGQSLLVSKSYFLMTFLCDRYLLIFVINSEIVNLVYNPQVISFLLFFFLLIFLLKYSGLTVMWQFQLYSRVIRLNIYIVVRHQVLSHCL